MKITTLIAAAALAGASSTAFADNVTTATGEVVMVEKEAATIALLGLSAVQLAALGFLFVATAATAADSGGGS